MVIYGKTKESVHEKLRVFADVTKEFGLILSWKKTKVMSNEGTYDLEFLLDNNASTTVEGVSSFPFLGSTVTPDGRLDVEVGDRISKANRAWWLLDKHVWKNRRISIMTKEHVYWGTCKPVIFC